ncbi:ATP12 family chaperone protein [Yoonia vestfoldensis]|jgi:chaperone required for assembly of F1-ATPase|uniref:ATP12 chaperone protein n=1 Tax=Yoonia vestfoldensis TaxID=245188 RepID=A0A1Y0EG65_9RHOB|nr:ATP12 family protein [Yoonia vestfoldensis]ARU02341.1 ATP12 chaperone protein [Yoonia vestfoldensis]
MSDWKPKRFWKTATPEPCEGGFTVTLDGRPVKTPAKAGLIVPTLPLAVAVAQEWDAQTGLVDPRTMPVTRSANAAIDKVRIQRAEVIGLLAEYGSSDLLCYRAPAPDGLVLRQRQVWDPLLDWAARDLGVTLAIGEGVVPVPQAPESILILQRELERTDDFGLAAAHDLISLSGSLILALAVMRGHLDGLRAWDVSRVDEDWQISQWGLDDDAAANAAVKRDAFLHAERFYHLSRP